MLMKRRTRAAGLCLVILFSGVAAGRAVAAAMPAGSLSGRVVDPNGAAVEGASVFLDDYDYGADDFHPIVKTTTATDGSFHLGPLKPEFRGGKALRILAAGFAPTTVSGRSFSIFPGANTDLNTIPLDRGQILRGQLLDFDGSPLPDAAVECACRVYVRDSAFDPATPTYHLKTDARGRFQTPLLPVSFAGITVRVPGRQMPWVRVPVGPAGQQDLPPIRLEKCDPILGRVVDQQGRGIAGATFTASGWDFGVTWLLREQGTTDADGDFAFNGLGRKIQFQINSPGNFGVNRIIRGRPQGLYWAESRDWDGDARHLRGPVSKLEIKMEAASWIEGRAIDADSGEPVHLNSIVICTFTRAPGGQIVLSQCQSGDFHSQTDGTFRVKYGTPTEYHLTLSAAGYKDGEAFTPPITRSQTVSGVVARMHRLKGGADPEIVRQSLWGTVMRDGRAVQTGWVVLRKAPADADKPNAGICRGRVVPSAVGYYAAAAIEDGRYRLNVPRPADDWIVVVEEPGGRIRQIQNVTVAPGQIKQLDIATIRAGRIEGRIDGISDTWKNDTWVVAFTRAGLRFETPVAADGSFAFDQLPPGEYGLKAGNDAFMDSERPPSILADDSPVYGSPAQPWNRARIVRVGSGEVIENVRLQLPDS